MEECVKIRYETEGDAIKAILTIKKRRKASKKSIVKESFHYQCPICDGWHLTTARRIKDTKTRKYKTQLNTREKYDPVKKQMQLEEKMKAESKYFKRKNKRR